MTHGRHHSLTSSHGGPTRAPRRHCCNIAHAESPLVRDMQGICGALERGIARKQVEVRDGGAQMKMGEVQKCSMARLLELKAKSQGK